MVPRVMKEALLMGGVIVSMNGYHFIPQEYNHSSLKLKRVSRMISTLTKIWTTSSSLKTEKKECLLYLVLGNVHLDFTST